MATQQERSRQGWNRWLRVRQSFPGQRIGTVIGILKLDACEYEEGKGHGPAAFANFAYYRAGRADLAGKNVDDATATGIRKAAAVQALLAKHGQAGLLRDDAESIVEAVWQGVTRVPAAQARAAPEGSATPMPAAPHASWTLMLNRHIVSALYLRTLSRTHLMVTPPRLHCLQLWETMIW